MDPISIAIATAIVGKVAEGATSDAWLALRSTIRKRFTRDDAALKALESAESPEASGQQLEPLAEHIERYVVADPTFRQDLELRFKQLPTANSNIVNSIGGSVFGNSVQGGTINVGQIGDRTEGPAR